MRRKTDKQTIRALCGRSLRVNVPQAAERLLSQTVNLNFAPAAKALFPPIAVI